MVNIQGIDTEYKPWGGLAGFTTGERRAEMDIANQQGLVQSQLGNAIKEVEARRAQADYSNPEMEMWRQRGLVGQNMSNYSKGELDYRTLDSKIKQGIAESMQKAGEAEIATTINNLDMITSAMETGNPVAFQQVLSRLPNDMKMAFAQMEQQNPGSSHVYARKLSDILKNARADSPKFRADRDIKNVEAENTYEIEWMKQQAANARNDADNRTKASEFAVRRAELQAGKDTARDIKLEEARTRRLNALVNQYKANETEIKRLKEEKLTLELATFPGKTQEERLLNKQKAKDEYDREIQTLYTEQRELRSLGKEYIGQEGPLNQQPKPTQQVPTPEKTKKLTYDPATGTVK
jgi:G:T/U-mismatch repair DNA glycosylase